jgi:hypothetical protein
MERKGRLWVGFVGMVLLSSTLLYVPFNRASLTQNFSDQSVRAALKILALMDLGFTWMFAWEFFRPVREAKRRKQAGVEDGT